MPDESDAVNEAADRLYSAAPEEFVALRAELAKAAEGDDAKTIKALRKPTVSASVVNRYVQSDPDVVGRLTALGDRLRHATKTLDAAQLRELSTERRTLVADTTRAAFAYLGSDDPPAAQRDEVSASFDAAVADPQIAQQLGRLVRPARFDGFGVVPGPELTLVEGGRKPARSSKPTTKRPAAKKSPEPEPAGEDSPTTRRLQRAATKARDAFEHADTSYDAATAAERTAHERVDALTDELTQLQRELDEAKRDLDRARKTARAAKTERRTAQSALDKAERQLEG